MKGVFCCYLVTERRILFQWYRWFCHFMPFIKMSCQIRGPNSLKNIGPILKFVPGAAPTNAPGFVCKTIGVLCLALTRTQNHQHYEVCYDVVLGSGSQTQSKYAKDNYVE